MSIRQFEAAQVKAPFLGKPHYPISGLDQLGLNLTSERIFDLLLPGLNNVTGRIRYYSFYCWFFDWYASQVRTTSRSKQNSYLRRAEFLLSLVAAHKELSGVPGITKALTIYAESDEIIDLTKGTQEGSKSEGSYWKNPRGVLGQYYISSIKQMGVLGDQGDKEGLYVRTDFQHETKISGKQLADAFGLNISNTSHIFAKAIENNVVTKTELELLSSEFNMLNIPNDSEEQQLLWQLFSGVDRPKEKDETYFRKDTIKLLLSNVDEIDSETKYEQLNVPFSIYNNGWNNDYSTSQKLWYFFIVEQFWSVSSTGCLDSFLKILDEQSKNNWIDEIELVDQIILKVMELFHKDGFDEESDLFFESTFTQESIQELVFLSKNEQSPYIKIQYALLAIQKLAIENSASNADLLEISNKFKIHTASSFLVSYDDFKSRQDLTIKEFVRYFLTRNVINRHHFVALRKLNATQNSAKFYREDGMIRLVDHFMYDYSSPRIHTLVDFMRDLSIIDTDSTALTQKGQEHLKMLAE
ncbi:hypothetical protein [Winogradskyella schleiferi]|uniref:hypothetical protein n=1 Tax=Winogradskyella schleiferi TaxID=2686078 RepID=UPI0015BAA575|nr:hypothetical protein [Winogradskyella schleiferi]